MPFTVAQRVALSAKEKYWQWKLVLRLILLVLAIISLGLLAKVAALVTTYGNNAYSSYTLYYVDVYVACALALCISWALISIPYLIIRKKPVHPGWNVGVDLIAWLALGIAAGGALTAAIYAATNFDNVSDGYSRYGYCDRGYGYGYHYGCKEDIGPSDSKARTLSQLQLAGAILACIVTLLEFALFVWACIDTHRRNRHTRDATVSEMTSRILADLRARGQIPAEGPYQPMSPGQPVMQHQFMQYPPQMQRQQQSRQQEMFHPTAPEPAMTSAASGNLQYGATSPPVSAPTQALGNAVPHEETPSGTHPAYRG